jgi:hypothetical protein
MYAHVWTSWLDALRYRLRTRPRREPKAEARRPLDWKRSQADAGWRENGARLPVRTTMQGRETLLNRWLPSLSARSCGVAAKTVTWIAKGRPERIVLSRTSHGPSEAPLFPSGPGTMRLKFRSLGLAHLTSGNR